MALALGAAKGNPTEPIRVYESMMRVTATERFELGSDLVGAAERGAGVAPLFGPADAGDAGEPIAVSQDAHCFSSRGEIAV